MKSQLKAADLLRKEKCVIIKDKKGSNSEKTNSKRDIVDSPSSISEGKNDIY